MKSNQSSTIDSNQSKAHPAWRSCFRCGRCREGIERGEERIRGKEKEHGGRRKHAGLLEAAGHTISKEPEGSDR